MSYQNWSQLIVLSRGKRQPHQLYFGQYLTSEAFLKFGLSEKHTNICAIFLMLMLRKIFFNFCVLFRKSEL